jgi:universal stress protein A
MLQPKLVLAPIDFSDPARDALETAANVASRFNAGLLLVHVVAALPKVPASVPFLKDGAYEKSLHDDAVKQLAELVAKYKQSGIAVQSEVGIANDVGSELLRIAEHHAADLIVIATHGMSGWNARIFGSVTEKVVRLAPVAVLVLRAPHETKA